MVESEDLAFRLKSKYELIYLDWLLFIEQCSSNTSQTKDGQVRGQLYLCSIDGRPQQHAATKDAHFTVLGFTAASGEPVTGYKRSGEQELIPLLSGSETMMKLLLTVVMGSNIHSAQLSASRERRFPAILVAPKLVVLMAIY